MVKDALWCLFQLPFVSFTIEIISNKTCKDVASFFGVTNRYFDLLVPKVF
jgi:hypothetical protein